MRPGEGKEPTKWGSSVTGLLVGLSAFLVVSLLACSPRAMGQGALSLSTYEPSFLADISLNGYGLGMKRASGGSYGLGLSLTEELLPETGDWEFRPFLSATLPPGEEPELDQLTAGIDTSYFDYRIGGWTLSVDSLFWMNRSSQRLASSGAFSVGNINLSYELGVSGEGSDSSFWFPRVKESEFTHLYKESLAGIENPQGNYLTLSGGNVFTVEEERLTWTQGVSLDYRKEPASLTMGTDISYKGSSLSFLVDQLRLARWSLELKWDKIIMGYMSSGNFHDWQGVLLGYRGDIEFDLEFARKSSNSDSKLNLVVRW